MTEEEMIALAQKQLDAYNKRDLETFCTVFHQEVVTTRLSTGAQTVGMEKFREMYANMFAASPNLHCELVSRKCQNGLVLDEESVVGIMNVPGVRKVIAIYGFRDGKIDRVWFA